MMNKRTLLLWNVLAFFTVVSILYTGFRLYKMNAVIDDLERRAEATTLGTDRDLEEIIAYLEARLGERMNFKFALENQPMRLTNVVTLPPDMLGYASYRQSKTIRVSAIVAGENPSAVVNYRDTNFNLTVGDTLAGERVIGISATELIMDRKGKEIHYPVLGLTMSEEDAALLFNPGGR